MTYTPIPAGTQNWDVPVNEAFTDQDGRLTTVEGQTAANTGQINVLNVMNNQWQSGGLNQMQNNGILAQNYPAEAAVNAGATTSGTLHMMRVDTSQPITINSVIIPAFNVGNNMTAGGNWVGIYDPLGNLLAQTADQSVNFTGAGTKTCTLTAPLAVPAGPFYVAILCNSTGTTLGPLRALSSTNLPDFMNFGLTVSNARWATGGTGLTTLPTNVTMSSRAFNGNIWWIGVI